MIDQASNAYRVSYVLGFEAMEKIVGSKVLLVGLDGLGVEIGEFSSRESYDDPQYPGDPESLGVNPLLLAL